MVTKGCAPQHQCRSVDLHVSVLCGGTQLRALFRVSEYLGLTAATYTFNTSGHVASLSYCTKESKTFKIPECRLHNLQRILRIHLLRGTVRSCEVEPKILHPRLQAVSPLSPAILSDSVISQGFVTTALDERLQRLHA